MQYITPGSIVDVFVYVKCKNERAKAVVTVYALTIQSLVLLGYLLRGYKDKL